jgi:hypothetical protein
MWHEQENIQAGIFPSLLFFFSSFRPFVLSFFLPSLLSPFLSSFLPSFFPMACVWAAAEASAAVLFLPVVFARAVAGIS